MEEKMKLRILFVPCVLFSCLIVSQVIAQEEKPQHPDSTIVPKISLYNVVNSPLYPALNYSPELAIPDYSFNFQQPRVDISDVKLQIKMSKVEFNNALSQIPEFNNKNDLGLVGDILMYTNTAATLYLLYKHVEKYGLK